MFRQSLLTKSQLLIFTSSILSILTASSTLLWLKTRDVSSANKQNDIILEVLQISFIYIINSNGPGTEPWGTPQVTVCSDERAEL